MVLSLLNRVSCISYVVLGFIVDIGNNQCCKIDLDGLLGGAYALGSLLLSTINASLSS